MDVKKHILQTLEIDDLIRAAVLKIFGFEPHTLDISVLQAKYFVGTYVFRIAGEITGAFRRAMCLSKQFACNRQRFYRKMHAREFFWWKGIAL